MSSSVRRADVAVIGAGAIGLASAWRLRARGASVVVCDPRPASAATRASAGMIAAVSESHFGEEALLALNLAGAARWPSFAAELERTVGEPSGYEASGSVAVALDGDDKRELDRLAEYQLALGLAVEPLTAMQCRSREAVLSPRIRGALWIPDDHRADNRVLAAALRRALEQADVSLVREEVAAVETGRDGVRGIRLRTGDRVEAATVVLAAGPWSASIEGVPEAARPPVRPVKGQILRLQGPADAPMVGANIRATVHGRHLYVVPRRDGRIVVGATQEELGFDTTVTAEGVHDLLRDLIDLCPGLAELPLVETSAGLRPGTPDNGPVVGRAGPEGLIIATGHFRHGILLTPITAEAVASLVAGEAGPAELEPFGPGRFSGSAAA